MCSLASNWQCFGETRLGLAGALLVAAVIGAAILPRPGFAADESPKDKAAEAKKKAENGGRVFSKDKPLFKRQIPEVTPGPDGSTKAEVITDPKPATNKPKPRKTATPAKEKPAAKDAASKEATAAKNDKTPKKSAGTKAPAVRIINNANAGEPEKAKPDAEPASKVAEPVIKGEPSEKSEAAANSDPKSKNTKAADRAERDEPPDRRKVAEPGQKKLVALPVRKPAVPASQRGRAEAARSKARAKSRSDRTRQAERDLPPLDEDPYYSPPRDRPPFPRTARSYDRYDPPPVQRRYRRRPDWRRGAPPGATGSYVRCFPDGRCVRFYRVRKPRNFHEFRRLRQWERRQRRAARYRAWRRRYHPDYY